MQGHLSPEHVVIIKPGTIVKSPCKAYNYAVVSNEFLSEVGVKVRTDLEKHGPHPTPGMKFVHVTDRVDDGSNAPPVGPPLLQTEQCITSLSLSPH